MVTSPVSHHVTCIEYILRATGLYLYVVYCVTDIEYTVLACCMYENNLIFSVLKHIMTVLFVCHVK